MSQLSSGGEAEPTYRVLTAVLLFWLGYVALTLILGFATSITIPSEVWQLTAWGFLSSAGLLVLPRLLEKRFDGRPASLDQAVRPSSLGRFGFGVLLGAASFGVHLAVVHTFAGPIRLEVNSEVGVVVAAIFFLRFLATSCMEEIGFRGYTLQRLESRIGVWPAVLLTAGHAEFDLPVQKCAQVGRCHALKPRAAEGRGKSLSPPRRLSIEGAN